MNNKLTNRRPGDRQPDETSSEPASGVLAFNRFSPHDESTLQYLRELGLPDYTELEGPGYADISKITRAIFSPEEIQNIREFDSHYAEFTKAVEMVYSLPQNPRKAVAQRMGASPTPLTESELRDAFAWTGKDLATAKSIVKQNRKKFFKTNGLPLLAMVFGRVQDHLAGVIKGRASEEMRLHKEQIDRFFKDDKSFRFQASGELRGLIKRFLYLKDYNFTTYIHMGGDLESHLRGILAIGKHADSDRGVQIEIQSR